MSDIYDKLFAEEDAKRKVVVRGSLDAKPDTVAAQRRDAAVLGVTPAVVAADPEASKDAYAKLIEADIARAPALGRKMSNPDFAAVAHDDVGVLATVEGWVANLSREFMGANDRGESVLRSIPAGIPRMSAGLYGLGGVAAEAAAPLLDPLARLTGAENPLRQAAGVLNRGSEVANAAADAIATPIKRGGRDDTMIGRALQSAGESTGQTAVALPLGVLGAGTRAANAGLVAQSSAAGGQSAQEGRKSGLSPEQALLLGLSDATAEFAGERVGFKRLVEDTLRGTGLFKVAARQLVPEVLGENATTALQDLNAWALLPQNKDKTFGDYLAERPAAAAETTLATIFGVGGNAAISRSISATAEKLLVQQREATIATADADKLAKLMVAAAKSKLRERDPESFAQLVQAAADDRPGVPSSVFIDASVLLGDGEKGGLVTREELTQLVPELTDQQLDEAQQSGGAVELPLGTLAARVAGTPLEQSLLDNVRTTPEGLSRVEAKAVDEQVADLSKLAQTAVEQASDAIAVEQERETVRATLLAQLKGTQRFTDDVNEVYARIASDFFTTMAQRVGMTPAQLYARYPLRISGAPVGGLDQPAYHGTPYRDIKRFTTEKIGTGEGAQAYGWGMYFAGNRNIAEFYRKSVAGKIDWTDEQIAALNLPPSLTRSEFDELGRLSMQMVAHGNLPAGEMARWRELKDRDNTYKAAVKKASQGQTYQVEVPDDDKLLDYHAKVADQPEAVRKALEGLGFGKTFDVIDNSGKLLQRFVDRDKARAYMRANNVSGSIKEQASKAKGEEVYRDLSNRLGSDRAASEALAAAGIPGLRYLDAGSRGQQAQNKTQNYVIFRDGDVKVTGEFYQSARGTFNPSTLQISLLEKADLSTFLHELGHFGLEVMADLAAQPGAPASVVEDMAALLRWFGIKAGDNKTALDTWRAMSLDEQRPHHEKFTEGFEQYLFEGKAPTHDLQPVFAKMRAWMLGVYKSLKQLLGGKNASLTPSVRGVFDRMLAAQDAIDEAQSIDAYMPLFKDAASAGMTDDEFKSYLALGQQATDNAVSALTSRSLRDMRWVANARAKALVAEQKRVEGLRKATEKEVRAELEASPIERARAAIRALQKEQLKVSAAAKEQRAGWTAKYKVAEAESREAHKQLPMEQRKLQVQQDMLQWELNNPAPQPELPDGALQVLADTNGFKGVDHMQRVLAEAPSIEQEVEGLVDRRLLEEHGDTVTPSGMKRAADEAVHNEARARFIATGLKALADAKRADGEKGPSVNVLLRAAKQYAAKLVGDRPIRGLSVQKFKAAEARAGKAALQATAEGDTRRAIAETRGQMLNNQLVRAATTALEEVERGVRYLRSVSDSKTLDPDYRDQIDSLLERFDLKEVSGTQAAKRKALAEWVASQRELGIEPELAPELLAEAYRKPYRDMTVDEFRGLEAAVRQIEHLGRLKTKLLTAKDAREFAATRDAIAASIIEHAGDRKANTRSPTTNLGRALQAVKRFGAAHIKAATWARVMDGGKDGGPVWEYFVRSANERADYESTQRAKATTALAEILGPWMKRGGLGVRGTYFPSIDRELNREAVLAIALNTGNDGNMQRLLDGEGWTAEQLAPVLASLTRDDWTTVQKVWDYFDSYRGDIGAKQKRVYGTEPQWVQPVARAHTLADGTTVDVRGGYFPVKYDPAASVRAEEHADAEGAKRQLQGAYGAATTRRSFTKTRAEEVKGRPLLYTLSGVYSGVSDVIHDLAWHEWLIDTNRLLKSEAIDSAMRTKYGPEAVRQMKSWRDAIAEGDGASQEALDSALGYLRQSVSVAGLGFNIMSALIQPLGITQSMVRVGTPWVAKGLVHYLSSPMRADRTVRAASEFMRNRDRTRLRELNELRNRVQGAGPVKLALQEYAYFMMMKVQAMVDVPTWLGAYEKAVAAGNDEARAVALADQAVKDAQGGGQITDLSAIERGGPAQKLFTVFYTFMNTALNLGVAAKMTPGNKVKFAADLLLLYTVPAVLGALFKDALTPGDAGGDDEDLLKKLAAEQISYLMGLMVLVREFANVGKFMAGGEDFVRGYEGPAGLRLITETGKAAQQIGQGEADDQLRKTLVNMAGYLVGLPAAQINRTVTGVQALEEGKTQNPAALLFGYQEPR